MKIFMRCALGALAFLAFLSPLAAQQKPLRVVATNTWTAAFAAAAGVTDIVTLAPADLRHPAEYELKPSDVAALHGADLILSTGFEVMAKRLAEAAGKPEDTGAADRGRLFPRDHAQLPAGDCRGCRYRETGAGEHRGAGELHGLLEGGGEQRGPERGGRARTRLSGAPDAGARIHGEGRLRPRPPGGGADLEALDAEPVTFIVDNWHNEVGGPLRETVPSARYVSLINFPGPDGTVTLLDVLTDNRKRLAEMAVKPGGRSTTDTQ